MFEQLKNRIEKTKIVRICKYFILNLHKKIYYKNTNKKSNMQIKKQKNEKNCKKIKKKVKKNKNKMGNSLYVP